MKRTRKKRLNMIALLKAFLRNTMQSRVKMSIYTTTCKLSEVN